VRFEKCQWDPHSASSQMSRSNNVRGPTSALTEFLKVCQIDDISTVLETQSHFFQESGITPTTVARRVATREQQPVAGPSGLRTNVEEEAEQEGENNAEAGEASPRRRTRTRAGAVRVFRFHQGQLLFMTTSGCRICIRRPG
jgi:hypothetical protein